MTLDGLVDCVDPDAPAEEPTSAPPPPPSEEPTEEPQSEPTIIDVTGTLICDVDTPEYTDDLAPQAAPVTFDGNQWSYGWTTRGLADNGDRWSDRNGSDVGSYREQVELEYGPPGQPPVLGARMLHERGLSSTGTRVDIFTAPDRSEQNTTGSSVDGGPFQWRIGGYVDFLVTSPTQLQDGIGLQASGVFVEDGWTLRALQVGGRIFTRSAQLSECQLRLERDDVPAEFQDVFGTLGTDQPFLPQAIWRIGSRFE